MKIFGYEFWTKSNAITITDASPPKFDEPQITTKALTSIKAVPSPTFAYHHSGGMVSRPSQRRNIFEPTEYDLYEIGRIEDVDGYVRQAFKKKVGLFLKEGFDYIGSNKRTVKYLKARFAQITRATSIPHNELIRRLVSSFVRKSNAFLVKVRNEASSGGKVRTDINGKSLKPIAGYFFAPPETMEVETDGSGKPITWRQRLPNGIFKEFKPEDVIHFTFDRKEGFLFGTPAIVPVIDDIRALRKIEENIELLIYKHLFPLFQYVVGTETMPASITEDGHREIDVVRQELQMMPTEGGIVTPERHEIRAIGAESKALRAEDYLTHFKNRVFSGLGMSAVDFGEPDTSNKSTADNMSRALIDDIKDYQDAFEAQFNEFIINELLLEAVLDEDALAPENIVQIYFREVDIDKQIKMETHAADLFVKHGVTWDELRHELGRDPILTPEDGEDQDPAATPEWHNTYWKLFSEPEKLITAGDEPYSTAAKAAAESKSTALTPTSLGEQQAGKLQSEKELAIAKEKAKPKPKVVKRDNFLTSDYANLQEVVVTEFQNQNPKMDYLRQKLNLIAEQMAAKLRATMFAAFISGFGSDSHNHLPQVKIIRNKIQDRSHLLMRRLVQDIESTLKQRVDSETQDVRILIRVIFDAFRYRIDFITQAEVERANNLGKVLNAVFNGASKGKYTIEHKTCDRCKQYADRIVNLENYDLEDVPPHHPHCNCGLQVTEVRGQS